MNSGDRTRTFGPYMISDPRLYELIRGELRIGAGIYFLRCLRSEDPKAGYRSVQRFLGVDSSGILYIGSGNPACNRVATLRKALCTAAGQQGYAAPACHGVGKRYAHREAQHRYPFEYLCVTIREVAAGEERYEVEQRTLNDYEGKFGEVPPFNERRKV
jgi:hypothetical protein